MSAEHDAVELEVQLGKIIDAVRVINQHHNLGDAVYNVRESVISRDPAYQGDTWHHPIVNAYSDAVKTLGEQIGGWAVEEMPKILPTPRNCPFCAQPPEQEEVNGRIELFCNNFDCPASLTVEAEDLATAIERWNRRDSR